MQVHFVEIENGSWSWEVLDNYGHRVTWAFADSSAQCMKDLRQWYVMLYAVPIDTMCQCGGLAAGYRAFDAGHSHWCPVSPRNLIYEAAP